MRILYIVQYYTGPRGTGLTRHYENPRRLVAMGHEVVLLCGISDRASKTDVADGQAAGIDIHQAPIRFFQRYGFLRRIIDFQRFVAWAMAHGKEIARPDVIYASSGPLTVGDIGRRLAAYHRVPFVLEVRDLWPEAPIALGALRNPLLRWSACRMARRVYAAANHVVALSPDMKAAITGWGVPADRITVIPNCSDNSLFGNAGLREPERRRRGWDGQLVCLYPGAMGLSNGLDYLLDCAKILDQWQISGIHLALVGFGAHSQRLAARVASEGIRSAAVYDPVARMDMPRLLAAADVGLVCFLPKTCLAANSANKLFDFFAAGLPTVINYGGWQSELLRESGAGVSTDPSDPASLAKVLLQLRDTPELRAEMGGAGLRLAHQQFDRDALVRQLEELLRSIATTDRTSRALSRMA